MARLVPRSHALVGFLLLVLMTAGCVSKPLVEPPPIAAAPTPSQSRGAILRALAESNWVLESEHEGEIVARYSRSNWTMAVTIAYSKQISIRYLRSENLGYETSDDGTRTIHRGYNRRVQRLQKVIGNEIMLARTLDSPPPVAAPPPSLAPAQ